MQCKCLSSPASRDERNGSLIKLRRPRSRVPLVISHLRHGINTQRGNVFLSDSCSLCLIVDFGAHHHSNMSSKLGISTSNVGEGSAVRRTAPVKVANTTTVYEKYGNQYDELDMDRMGKLQELRVSTHMDPRIFKHNMRILIYPE